MTEILICWTCSIWPSRWMVMTNPSLTKRPPLASPPEPLEPVFRWRIRPPRLTIASPATPAINGPRAESSRCTAGARCHLAPYGGRAQRKQAANRWSRRGLRWSWQRMTGWRSSTTIVPKHHLVGRHLIGSRWFRVIVTCPEGKYDKEKGAARLRSMCSAAHPPR